MSGKLERYRKCEANGSFDFGEMFIDRLSAIKPFDEHEGKMQADALGLEEIGILQVKRRTVALVFSLTSRKKNPLEIWVEDIKGKLLDFPHREALESLGNFLKEINRTSSADSNSSAWIIQDAQDRLYLLSDRWINRESSRTIATALKKSDDRQTERGKDSQWFNLVEKYKLEKIIGSSSPENHMHGIFVSSDVVGRIRLDDYLREVAKKYQMTNSQYMRLRIRILSAKGAKNSINYEDTAREIVAGHRH